MTLFVSSFYKFCIESNILQLVSMLVCIAVVVCFFIKKYSSGKDIDDSEHKIQKLHTFYVAGILVFIIVELVTGICMGSSSHSEILNYVNFASTVSSLIMSVVAIIVTIVFSNRGSVQFGKLETATDDVKSAVVDLKRTSTQMTGSLDFFSGKAQNIEDLINAFQADASSLKLALSDILDRLCKIEDKTDKAYEATMGENSPKKKNAENGQSQSFQDFIDHSSFLGSLLLYACALSYETKIPLNLNEISEGTNEYYYIYGYFISSQAAGYVQSKVKVQDNIFEVLSIPDNMKLLSQKRLNTKLTTFKKESQSKYDSKIKRIETYFQVTK